MKRFTTLALFSCLFFSSKSFSQLTLLPSAGVQTTYSKVDGFNPVLSPGKQYMTNSSASFRAFIDNKKGHGIFVGISAVNAGVSVKTYENNPSPGIIYSQGSMSSVMTVPRIELGYQLLSKPFYFNDFLNTSSQKRGMFIQFQPMVGLGYNLSPRMMSHGSTGAGNTRLEERSGLRNWSLLAGGNIYIGKKNKPWLFISIMKNMNFGRYYSATGTFYSQSNNVSYTNTVRSMGSGTSYSIGVPIRIGAKKKK